MTLLIKNATVYTMEKDGVLENTDILIKDGKFSKLGKNLKVKAEETLDGTGLHVLPGLIDGHSHSGGFDIKISNSDVNEFTEPCTPQMEAVNSINKLTPDFKHNKKTGTTSICVVPGSSNVIGGLGVVLKTYGRTVDEMVVKNPAALKCAMGGSPKGGDHKPANPKTRMGIVAMLEGELIKAKDYLKKKEDAGDDKEKMPKFDVKMEAMIPVIKKEIPIKVHCEQMDMVSVIKIAKKHDINYTIEHGWTSNLFLDELVDGGGPILFGPIGIADGFGEASGGDVAIVKEMLDRGLHVSLMTDCPCSAADLLMISAGEAVRNGVDHLQALKMITINPAEALGVSDRIGSIKAGKDADLAIFAGVPALDVAATVRYTVIDGKIAYDSQKD